ARARTGVGRVREVSEEVARTGREARDLETRRPNSAIRASRSPSGKALRCFMAIAASSFAICLPVGFFFDAILDSRNSTQVSVYQGRLYGTSNPLVAPVRISKPRRR